MNSAFHSGQFLTCIWSSLTCSACLVAYLHSVVVFTKPDESFCFFPLKCTFITLFPCVCASVRAASLHPFSFHLLWHVISQSLCLSSVSTGIVTSRSTWYWVGILYTIHLKTSLSQDLDYNRCTIIIFIDWSVPEPTKYNSEKDNCTWREESRKRSVYWTMKTFSFVNKRSFNYVAGLCNCVFTFFFSLRLVWHKPSVYCWSITYRQLALKILRCNRLNSAVTLW